jgi:hypothetical protein
MRFHSLLVVTVLAATSCVIGAPPGFSSGSRWTFPLVAPLDNGLLVTPVWIKGKGPYLFAIDPEANVSIIDERIVIDAGLVIDKGYSTRLYGEDGERRIRFNAEVRNIQLGNLTIESRRAIVVPHETLAATGRDIRGVLGRNVLADSLVFGFDRDRGIGWLQTASSFTPPPGATRIAYKPSIISENHLQALAHANVGGRDVVVELQLGSAISRLRPTLGQALGVGGPARTSVEFDATGARRVVAVSATPIHVSLGGMVNDRVAVAPYLVRSELPSASMFFDGTLGQDFFTPFTVYADWNDHAFYLVPREAAPQTSVRLGRWADLAGCTHPGCVTIAIAAPQVPAPTSADAGDTALAPPSSVAATPTAVLHVTRDPGVTVALEVRLRAAQRADLPDLVVDLPAGAASVLAPVRGDLAGVQYDVVDVSPFAAACPSTGGCARADVARQ